MSDNTNTPQPSGAVQTTGHAWDSDLQEYNNPLPRWWLWCFYGTVVFSILYWFIYPSWPVGNTWIKGFGTVEYTAVDKATGQEQGKEFRWNTRALLLEELGNAANDQQRKAMLAKVQAADYEQIAKDPKMMEFVRSVGKGLFGDNCAACHGRGGQGVVGMYPNLTDDDWLWGSSTDKIHETLVQGRKGFMPAFGQVLKPEQLDDVAEYVLTLSDEAPSSEDSERGKVIFQGQIGGCYYCHGADAKGIPSQGAANLTDKIWAIANVPAQKTLQDKKAVIKEFVAKGVNNTRVMPAWKDRLSPTDIKLLAVYVHQLGGAQ
ncbi:MAG TPA: cytochrome-c oxidase, cbb3-type subunit III [Candidatus Competibacteraceae bacterium]|nr:cytochrome-c oxidase, cbb3-type subunit III [Candidatus Competibacteraceae bacterium]MCP5134013.1 cytochrome-c oxidase, cbb3-type subunit III [Gammaproteobacteria bacterium]HPF58432.1 cytochrome-c oxidase, cbb3-type subunit III [Candidatus Competibacteraceae bacterium]HRY17782.1 cytochrome-c oxidase, cbb3-type subunit III [Candidatus Competibacteraceae bacterium]